MPHILPAAETLLLFAALTAALMELFTPSGRQARLRGAARTLIVLYCSFACAATVVFGLDIGVRHLLCAVIAMLAHLCSDAARMAGILDAASRMPGTVLRLARRLRSRIARRQDGRDRGPDAEPDVEAATLDDFRNRPPEPPANQFVAQSARVSDERTMTLPRVDGTRGRGAGR